MSIIDCSNDVSLRSAAVDSVFLKEPATVVCDVLNKAAPSPDLNVPKPFINGSTALTCFAFDIDLAKAFVYLAASLS